MAMEYKLDVVDTRLERIERGQEAMTSRAGHVIGGLARLEGVQEQMDARLGNIEDAQRQTNELLGRVEGAVQFSNKLLIAVFAMTGGAIITGVISIVLQLAKP